jgi:magnesium transporter
VIVDCAHYRHGMRQHDAALPLAEAGRRRTEEDGFVWVGLQDPTPEELEEARVRFGLPALAVEDAGETHQRPKLEDYGADTFVVLRTARYDEEREAVDFGEVHLFVGPRHAVVIRRGPTNELREARRRLEERPELAARGPAAVVWAVVDKVVDDYEPVVAGLENDVEEVEQAIFQDGRDQSARIYFLRRELAGFFRAVHPLLAPLEALERGTFGDVHPALRPYFRDVADHVRRVHEEVVMQRDLLDGMLNANLSAVAVRQNEVVRKVSGWAAIGIVPTLIASIYGMNFERMPELSWPLGYPFALALMALVSLSIWRVLRRSGWL